MILYWSLKRFWLDGSQAEICILARSYQIEEMGAPGSKVGNVLTL